MPIDPPAPRVARCEWDQAITAILQPNDLDEEDEDDDTQMPLGWVRIIARRVVPNPEYAEAMERFQALWKAQVAQLKEQGAPKDFIAAARDAFHAQHFPSDPAHSLQEIEGVYSAEYASRLQTAARLPAWPTDGGNE